MSVQTFVWGSLRTTYNAPGLEPDAAYTPFALYAALEHRGDFSAAAKMLAQERYGG